MDTNYRAERDERAQLSKRFPGAATNSIRCTLVKRTAKKFAGVSIALMALALTAPFISNTAQAQRMCGDHTEILEALEQKHKETVHAIGIAQGGGLLEILVSPAGGWTILVTYPQRSTCVVAAGQDWSSRLLKIGKPT
ncbi:MAG: hypothetical protein ACTSX7_15845 [Alphaproteobacteria bacterium]